MVFSRAANSFIIVVLLLALSHVTWPTFAVEDKHGTLAALHCVAYLMLNSHSSDDLE